MTGQSFLQRELDSLPHRVSRAYDLAGIHCLREHGCQQYHGYWPLLRARNPHGRVPAGAGFLQRVFERSQAVTPLSILIAGAADTGLPALVVQSLQEAGLDFDLTLADRCQTPLLLNSEMFASSSINISVIHADLLEPLDNVGAMDFIVLHSLLNFFSPQQRAVVIRNLARALKPGGMILLSNKMRLGESFTTQTVDSGQEEQASCDLGQLAPGPIEQEVARAFERDKSYFDSLPLTRHATLAVEDLPTIAASAGLQLAQCRLVDRNSDRSERGPASNTVKFADVVRGEVAFLKPGDSA